MKLVSLENITKYNELLNKKIVKSVNSVKPDSNGNVTLGTEKSTFNKVVYDTGYFSIGTAKTYSFDLTGSDLENVSKDNVNIRLVAKVITAHYGFNVGDIAQLSPGVDYTNSYGDLDVCAYIRGNTLYVYSGDAGALSIATGKAGHLQKANVQIKAVLTAFIPDDGSILLIAEDQTNTSKLIGLPDGTLTWGDKNIVRSVNGVNADENGNVEITTSGADLTGVVKSVNNIQPDENGNVTIEVPSADIDTSEFVKSVNGSTPDSTGNISIDIPSTDGMVKSVNSQIPDSNGNVDITIPEVDLSGLVKSVNNIQPDENGSLTLEIPSTDGMVKSINSVKPDESGNVDITIPKPITNIVGVTDNRNLGEIFYSALPQTSSQVHLLDGSVLTDTSELYDYLESIKDSHPDLFTTDSEFNSEVESTGKCSKFVINTDNKTVRIPKGDSNNYIVIKSFEKKFEFNQPFTLLEPKWSDVPLNNPSWLLSNGQVNSQENYPSVYELLLNEYNNGELKTETIGGISISFKQLDNGHKIVTDKTAYNSILESTGTAWYYLLDLDSRTFVLPQTNGYMKYGNSNEFIKQSLPNIKGQTGWTCTSGDDETTAPFSKIFTSTYGASSGPSYPARFTRIGFDASSSSDIYADGANVNPNAVQGYLYFYVGEFVGTSNSVNLGDIKDKLDLDIANLKTEVTELNNLKGNISTYAFPSEKNVVLTIPASKTRLTAPANGWFVYQSTGGGAASNYMFISNVTTAYYACQTRPFSGYGMYVNCPAKKGESVYFEWVDSGTIRNLKFVYATDQDIEE